MLRSSMIDTVGVNDSDLVITFKNRDGSRGKTYAYRCDSPGAALEHQCGLETAESAGAYFHERLAGRPSVCLS